MRRSLRQRLARVVDDLVAAVFPAACRRCGAVLEVGATGGPAAARPYSALYSGRLRRQLGAGVSVPLLVLCPGCCSHLRLARRVSGRAAWVGVVHVSAFEPGPEVFELVHALKYDGLVELAPWLGAFLAAAARRALPAGREVRLVPVPLHPTRAAQRGFNQSLLLTREVGRRLAVPVCARLLERRRPTPPLAQVPLRERRASVRGAFARTRPLPAGDPLVVLVDDVVTTGATCEAALEALTAGTATRAIVLSVCRARDTGGIHYRATALL
ncbi:MAG: ComF family protein [Candidatus Krumholzibacteriia bacterium]